MTESLPIICDFCKNIMNYNDFTHNLKIYYCNVCQVEYSYWRNSNKYLSKYLYATINEKYYRWRFYSDDTSELCLIPGLHTLGKRPFEGKEIIKNFDTYLKINPTNIQGKINIILTFI